jgi:hypothetical protein
MREGKWVVVGIPAAATAALRTERRCSDCGCRYAFIGSAFFCPGCGKASAEENFAQSVATVRRTIEQCQILRKTLSADDAANLERALFEKAVADLVTVFQLMAEALYQRLTATSAPTNAFQRLDGPTSGEALWLAATGRSYADHISTDGMAKLRKYFHRRHLLAHKDGFIDQTYLDRSGDEHYKPGQRLVVRGWEVEEFAYLVETLIIAMREAT